jgi:hypothetical protein
MSEASLVASLHHLYWVGLGDGDQRHSGWVAPHTQSGGLNALLHSA